MPHGKAAQAVLDHAYYDRVYRDRAAYTADWTRSGYLPMWRKLVKTIKAFKRHRVLELGCGTGQLAAMLHHEINGLVYRGVDFSPVAIEKARTRNPSLRFEVADVRDPSVFQGEYGVAVRHGVARARGR